MWLQGFQGVKLLKISIFSKMAVSEAFRWVWGAENIFLESLEVVLGNLIFFGKIPIRIGLSGQDFEQREAQKQPKMAYMSPHQR